MGSSVPPHIFREAVILERLGSTPDLCKAVDSAQYARVYLYAEPETNAMALAIEAFIETFAIATEVWMVPEVPNKAPIVDVLQGRLRALQDIGVFVHHASIERMVAIEDGSEVILPVAVIAFGTDAAPTRTVSLPAQLQTCQPVANDVEE